MGGWRDGWAGGPGSLLTQLSLAGIWAGAKQDTFSDCGWLALNNDKSAQLSWS